MTELTLDEMWQSAPAQALLLKHRPAAYQEVRKTTVPRLLEVVKAIQPAAQAALTPTNTQADE